MRDGPGMGVHKANPFEFRHRLRQLRGELKHEMQLDRFPDQIEALFGGDGSRAAQTASEMGQHMECDPVVFPVGVAVA